jgi:hypothetical protein
MSPIRKIHATTRTFGRLALVFGGSAVRASEICQYYNVALNTRPLETPGGIAAGPCTLDFRLVDSSGDRNNSATIASFQIAGNGSVAGTKLTSPGGWTGSRRT